MAVQLSTLDILIERAHFEPEVARAIGDAITMEINHSCDTLVTQEDLIATRDDLKKELSTLFRTELSALRAEFETFRTETRQEFVLIRAEIRVAMAECKSEVLRWMFAALATQAALVVGIMYFMLQHMR